VRLSLPDKPEREFSYDFRQPVISLGRDPQCDIQIPLTTVSRKHARIFFEMGDYFLEDLGSTHGTEHNGRKLGKGEKCLLRDGDRITVMSFSITFKTSAGTALDRQPGEKTEALARRMVQEVLSSLDGKSEATVLRVMNGPQEGRRFVFDESISEITIGRSPDCDFPLDDQNISRRHCLIKRSWDGYTAQDLGSKNGVLVNEKRIEGVKLIKDGDEVQIGGIKLTFIDPPSRLLGQIGGLDAETEAGTSEAEPEEQQYEEQDEGGDEELMDEQAAPPRLEPEAELNAEKAPAAEDPEIQKVAAEVQSVTKKGVAWDMLILLFGGLFLFGAVALIVFLVL
jgi:pSer/pThr/pTyr-binding forkhead associated (FHA) protein